MLSGTNYRQGDILLTPFPFTNLTGAKQRPVLVLSKKTEEQDILVCGITSNLHPRPYGLLLQSADLAEGTLPVRSQIVVSKLFTVEKSIVRKRIARINPDRFDEARQLFYQLV